MHDLAVCVAAVRNVITAPVSQNEFDAMVMLTFNIGVSAFTTSSVSELVNNPNAPLPHPSLEAAWKAWDRSQGKVRVDHDPAARDLCVWICLTVNRGTGNAEVAIGYCDMSPEVQ